MKKKPNTYSVFKREECSLDLSFRRKNRVSSEEGETIDQTSIDKKKPWLLLALIVIVAIALLSGVALKATSTPQFCSSCHEMNPEYTTWQVTSHSKVACVTCHIPPGAVSLVKHKVASIRQLTEHITGDIPQPIVMREIIENSVCEQCHSSMRKVTPSGDIVIPHDKHLAQGLACVACHGGVAHGFVAERGLTDKKDYDTWTIAKADKVTKFDETKTAMEVCLDCHEQVNRGEKPWLIHEGVGQTEEQRIAHSEENKKTAAETTGKLRADSKTEATVGGTNTLKAPTTKCSGCHTAIPTPDSHRDQSWGTTHGISASKDVSNCAECHSRQQERAVVTAATSIVDYARTNTFCADCHAKRPAGHLADKKAWLPTHNVVIKDKGAGNCLVCHDFDKPKEVKSEETTILSPNPAYCNQCHWYKNKEEIY